MSDIETELRRIGSSLSKINSDIDTIIGKHPDVKLDLIRVKGDVEDIERKVKRLRHNL